MRALTDIAGATEFFKAYSHGLAILHKFDKFFYTHFKCCDSKGGILAKPVRLLNFKPDIFTHGLLQTLERSGFAAPFLRGGALRDDYLGIRNKINDYDIIAGFGSVIPDYESRDPAIRKRLADFIQDIFPNVMIMAAPNNTLDGDDLTGFIGTGLDFNIQDRPQISLYVSNRHEEQFEKSVLLSDAPINGIAMNSKGEIFAHPDFKNHAAQRLYKPDIHQTYRFREDLEERYDKLSEKIYGLVSSGLEQFQRRPSVKVERHLEPDDSHLLPKP